MPYERYVLLYERILHGKYGNEKRVYNKLEALIYLILKASYKDHDVSTKSDGVITVRRGELLCSLQDLSKTWKWSREKIKRFIENDIDIELKTYRHFSLIYLVNYDTYQSPFGENGPITGQKRTPNEHRTNTERARSNKGNNGNKGNTITSPTSGDDGAKSRMRYTKNKEPITVELADGLVDKYVSFSGMPENAVKARGYMMGMLVQSTASDIGYAIKAFWEVVHSPKHNDFTPRPIAAFAKETWKAFLPAADPMNYQLKPEFKNGRKAAADIRQEEIKKQADRAYEETQEYLKKTRGKG